MAAVVCSKLPKGPNNVVLSCNPAIEEVIGGTNTLLSKSVHTNYPSPITLSTEGFTQVPRLLLEKTSVFELDKNSPVSRELLVTHHELQVVYDYMTDVIDVDSMLHCVYDRPGKEKQPFKRSTSGLRTLQGEELAS